MEIFREFLEKKTIFNEHPVPPHKQLWLCLNTNFSLTPYLWKPLDRADQVNLKV